MKLLSIVPFLLLSATLSISPYSQAVDYPKYEYKYVESFTPYKLVDHLNNEAKNGWDLVEIVRHEQYFVAILRKAAK